MNEAFWTVIGDLALVLVKALASRDAQAAEDAVRIAAAKLAAKKAIRG